MTPANLPESADVVIIGGGIVGCCTAYYLSRQGISVVLCEKGQVGCEQSSRNWGFIRKQGRHPAEIPLMIRSLELWHELVSETGEEIGFHVGGTLYLSETEKRHQANERWMEHARNFNLDSRLLTVAELEKLAPGIRNQKRGGLYTPSDARAEPGPATRAISRLATRHGACVLEHCAVRGIDIEAGRVSGVITEQGRIGTSSAVCAGGAWSRYFCRHLDVTLPQLQVIGSVMATRPTASCMQVSLWSKGMGMRKRLDGGYNLACGGTADCEITPDFLRFAHRFLPTYLKSKETVNLKLNRRFLKEAAWPSRWALDRETPFEKERVLDPRPNMKLLNLAYRTMTRTFPELAGIGIARKWAGMIDVTPDELPIIDAIDTIPGLVISTGYSGHGFGLGPGAGKATADLVAGHRCEHIDQLSFSRFR